MRDLWTPGDVRFLRHWLFLGPMTDKLTGRAGFFAEPSAGIQETLTAGQTQTWQLRASWTDIVDIPSLLNTATYRGSHAASETAYAYTTIERDKAGDAVLSFASEGVAHVWLNGRLVDTVKASRPFLFDEDRMPVHLDQGKNRLLIELEHQSGPWRFAVRVFAPDHMIALVDEITPTLTVGRDGTLNIRTDITPDNPGASVNVTAVAPGGEFLEQADATRGATVRLATASWPDGPYEIRLTTKTAWGKVATVHLPWYKGDARLDTQKLLEAANGAPVDTSGATLRVLSDLVRNRLGDNPVSAPDDVWPLVQPALMEYAEFKQELTGKPGPVRPYGFVRLVYTGEGDGSSQFCRAYLPPHYDAARRWPLVISLHGFNPANPPYVGWWNVDKRHDAIADRYDVIVLEPHGRGNAQYLGIGEQDVLHCLSAAKQHFSVDDDRVYLTGESMGGSGTWLIASHHPELFAAAAPVFGGFDYRLVPAGGFDNPKADQLPERFAAEHQSSFLDAESLSNLPLFVTHGDSDQTVPVDFSRFAVTMLQRWNYEVRYEEIPGRGHEDLNLNDRIVSWLLIHRRIQAPREVRIRAFDLDNASAYWAQVVAFEEPLQAMDVDAEVLRPGLIRLDTQNVGAIRLSPPPALRGQLALKVVWNGVHLKATPDPDGTILLQKPDAKVETGDKRAGLQGGLSNFIATPFAVVMGTSSADPRMRTYCREKAEAFVQQWMNWQHVKPRLFRDVELTPADEQHYSLLLVGGADANLVSRRLVPRLPLRVTADAVTIDGHHFTAHDAVVQMIYPNPLARTRYVMVVAATSADGMYFWESCRPVEHAIRLSNRASGLDHPRRSAGSARKWAGHPTQRDRFGRFRQPLALGQPLCVLGRRPDARGRSAPQPSPSRSCSDAGHDRRILRPVSAADRRHCYCVAKGKWPRDRY